QFWYHTRLIPKLGWLEYLIITPAQHRVHHAINDIYLDKNLGEIFQWWDRMFGTFQEELDDVPCVYGIKRAPRTWNPIKINFQHLWLLMQDAWRTNSWWDKLRLWFMPTGWRPADVVEKYPIEVIEDPYSYDKYAPQLSTKLQAWTWFQFILTNIFFLHMLVGFTEIGFPQLFFYGGFIFLHIYAYSTLMDLDKNAIWFEMVKSVFGLAIIYQLGGWFTASAATSLATPLMIVYLIGTVVIVAGFVMTELQQAERNFTTA
ncbi:MAG: sterol desaturase family protein, partial [Saprospiraceae bacterium]